MSRDIEISKEVREKWFKNHIAKVEFDSEDLKIINWGQPGTNLYRVRYVFDKNRLYISGDIGSAIFQVSSKIDINFFKDINIWYFFDKLEAMSCNRYDWSSEECVSSLDEWFKNFDKDDYEEVSDEIEELMERASYCPTKEEWIYQVVNDEYNDLIRNLDYCYDEWIYDIGQVIPRRVYGWLIGLEMILEELEVK
ncbi:hypothetical protein [Clostridium perfringens]|uniref:Uncharacterized protein n=1 Tax=Clostridium perfringens TaxID=1502 RepID=A0AAP4A8Q2_CLOPF|nr:hypothetical protein [Clostridium perfringens]MDH2337327.1 hypothetical protein [Clostridium perfringens]